MDTNNAFSYENFYNPTVLFKNEPRALCYDLSLELIEKAKSQNLNWYLNEKTIDALL